MAPNFFGAHRSDIKAGEWSDNFHPIDAVDDTVSRPGCGLTARSVTALLQQNSHELQSVLRFLGAVCFQQLDSHEKLVLRGQRGCLGDVPVPFCGSRQAS